MSAKLLLFFFATLFAAISVVSAAIPTDNLVSYYKFDGDANDQLGGSGTFVGSSSFVQGQVGQAINFFGTPTGYVDLGEGEGVSEDLSAFSVSTWVYKRSTDNSRAGPVRQSSVFALHSGPNRKWQFLVRNENGQSVNAVAGKGVDFNTWTHLVGVYDGQTVKLYVDGVLQNSQPTLNGNTATTPNNLQLGLDYAYSSTINGMVDEMLFYTKALTAEEVQEIYDTQAGAPLCVNDPDCISEGNFCGANNPFTCTLSAEGCLVKTDQPACSLGSSCQSGVCVADPCFGINSCSNYLNSTSCNANSCNLNDVCSWNSNQNTCEIYVPQNNSNNTNNNSNSSLPIPTLGLKAYYAVEGEAYDEVSHEDGNLFGIYSFVQGQIGQAIRFNGSSVSYAGFGNGEGVSENLSAFSVSSWVYKNSSDGSRAGPVRQPNVFGLSTNPSRTWQFVVRNQSGQVVFADSDSDLISDVWTHLVGVYDGQTVKLYVDGVLQNSQPTLTGNTATVNYKIELGRDWAYSSTINGMVDDTMIYNRALTAEEISQIHQVQSASIPLCASDEMYVEGICIFDTCSTVNSCSDYTESFSCNVNSCDLNNACNWNANEMLCQTQSCFDGLQNQNETGIDCGGVCFAGAQEICGNAIDDNFNCIADEAEPICQITNTSWSFALMSDSYGGLHNSVFQAYNWALENNLDIKFMIEAGDFENEQAIDDLIQTLQPLYFPGHLYAPWFAAAGNHNADESIDMDFISDVLALRLATQLPGMTSFKSGLFNDSSVYGRRNTTYSFDYRDAHFVILNQYYNTANDLDGHPLACINPELYNWLEQDLKNTTKPFIFVVGHEPAWPNGDRHCGDSLDDGRCVGNYINWTNPARPSRDKFWELLKQYNVTAHLVGHEHSFSARVINTLDDFPGIQCDANGNCHCDNPHWNCYCNNEQGLANVPNNATITKADGLLEYNNGITRDNGHFHVIRVDGDKVEFNAFFNNVTAGTSTFELQKKITYLKN